MNTKVLIDNNLEVIHKIVNKKRCMRTFHYHNRYEIYYVVSGTQRYITDNGIYDLSDGDLCFINSNAIHRTEGITDKLEAYLIYCTFDAIESYGNNAHLFKKIYNQGTTVISFNEKDKEYIDIVFSKMYEVFNQSDDFSEQLLKNYFYELLTLSYKQSIAIEKELHNPNNIKLTDEIYAALDYINKNYKSNISLEDVAKHVNMSVTYFSKLFKKIMGIGFAKYLLAFRIKEASELLKNTSMSITEIALSTGFNSSQYFCKAFKIQNNTSPFQFRNDVNNTNNQEASYYK